MGLIEMRLPGDLLAALSHVPFIKTERFCSSFESRSSALMLMAHATSKFTQETGS